MVKNEGRLVMRDPDKRQKQKKNNNDRCMFSVTIWLYERSRTQQSQSTWFEQKSTLDTKQSWLQDLQLSPPDNRLDLESRMVKVGKKERRRSPFCNRDVGGRIKWRFASDNDCCSLAFSLSLSSMSVHHRPMTVQYRGTTRPRCRAHVAQCLLVRVPNLSLSH